MSSGKSDTRVSIVEMAARDGLQNEASLIDTHDKIGLVDRLSACGFERIEVTSFVSAKWVPQLADAAEVMAGISRHAGVRYTALTPNMRGFEAALMAGADAVAIFASASEGFSHANINCSIADSIERFRPLVQAAQACAIPVRGYVSCVVECPYEGPIPPSNAAAVAARLLALGCHEISLGDTLGKGTPEAIDRLLTAVLQTIPVSNIAGHFHDTAGRALDNIGVALQRGVRVFDASVGGLGGCPYAPGAKGNVDTLAIDRYLKASGYTTGLSQAALEDASAFARSLGHSP